MRKIVLSIVLVLLLGSMVSNGSTTFVTESRQDDTIQNVEVDQIYFPQLIGSMTTFHQMLLVL